VAVPEASALTITDILNQHQWLPITGYLYDYPDGPSGLRGSSSIGSDHGESGASDHGGSDEDDLQRKQR